MNIESFLSQLSGIIDAFLEKKYPKNIEEIIIVERNQARASRLQQIIQDNFTSKKLKIDNSEELLINPIWDQKRIPITNHISDYSFNKLEDVGIKSEAKPKIFVAMPFKEEMDDVYFYGIQESVRKLGFLCERIDFVSFTGDILERIKLKIDESKLVIADLTGANANVYLEIGYTWGRNKLIISLVRDSDELKFDVRGQRCLKYKRIIDLEETLENEISNIFDLR